MRLKRAIFTNYGCHGKLAIDFATVTKVLGPGGAGKSTIRDGLEMCVLGINDRTTDLKGAAFRPIATYGQGECSVVTEWVDPNHPEWGDVVWARNFAGQLHKDQSAMLTIKGVQQAGNRDALEKQFYSMTCRPIVWRLLFDSDKFATLSGEDCQRFLFTLTSGGVTVDDVEAKLKAVIDEKLWPAAQRMWKAESNPLDFERTLGRLYRARPDKRRIVEGYEAALEAAPQSVDKARLNQLRMKKHGIEEQQKALDAIADPTREIADIEAKIKEHEGAAPNTLEMLTKQREDRKLSVSLARGKQLSDAGVAAEVKQLEEAYHTASAYFNDGASPGSSTPKCPICATKITKAKLKLIQTAWEKAKAKLGDSGKAKKDLEGAEELLRSAERALSDAKAAAQRYEGWKEELKRLKAEDLPKWQNRPDRKKLNDDLVEILGELKALEEADKAAAERAEAERKLEGAKVEFEAIKALIAAYEPDGIRAEFAKGAQQFVENVRQGVRFYFGPDSDISFTDGTITRDGKTWEPLPGLSDSEAARVGIAVQLGLGLATGVWLVVTDHFAEVAPADQKMTILALAQNLKERGTALLLQQIPDVPTESGKAITVGEFVALEKRRLETEQFAALPLSVLVLDTEHKVTRLK